MTTKAGERLMSEEWDNFDATPWGSIADHVGAIEAEAAAAERARLAEAVRRSLGHDIEQLARDAEQALHCIWPTMMLRVLALLEPGP